MKFISFSDKACFLQAAGAGGTSATSTRMSSPIVGNFACWP